MDRVHELPAVDFFIRLGIAIAIGFIIGFEREWRQRTAGLHTFTLVAIGATIFTMLPVLLNIGGDSTRMAAQVVTGIGFLAGGIILKDGPNIRGLTTAATMWSTAAIGVLVGSGLVVQACVGALVVVSANFFLSYLVDAIGARPRRLGSIFTNYTIHVDCSLAARNSVRTIVFDVIEVSTLTLHSVSSAATGPDTIEITCSIGKSGRDDATVEALVKKIAASAGVTASSWDVVEEAA
jgi:putative Mg2+ transporter-C (MgtC) family protein